MSDVWRVRVEGTTTGWVLRLVDDTKSEHSGVNEVEVRVDDTRLGGGVTDRLNEINIEKGFGYTITGVNNGYIQWQVTEANRFRQIWNIEHIIHEGPSLTIPVWWGIFLHKENFPYYIHNVLYELYGRTILSQEGGICVKKVLIIVT